MLLSYQQQPPIISDVNHDEDATPVPQLTASSSSENTNKSWMERLACSMSLAGGYSCSGAHDTSMDDMAIQIDDVETAAIMDEDALHLLDVSITEPGNNLNAARVPMEINATRTSSNLSYFSIATEQGKSPTWTTKNVAYDFCTLLNLLSDLERGTTPLQVVRCLLEQDKWCIVFDSVSPKEYASLIMSFDSEFDRPEVAAIIAPSVNGGEFTHEYIIAVLGAVADWSRAPLITKLLPLCKDINENSEKIKAELSEWEIVCTKGVFEQAMNN